MIVESLAAELGVRPQGLATSQHQSAPSRGSVSVRFFRTRVNIKWWVALFTILIAGCDNSEARVTINANLPAPLEPGMLSVKVDDGLHTVTLAGSDFQPAGGDQYNGPAVETANHGTMVVSYTLATPGAPASVSSGSVELTLRNDWTYGVDIRADTADPRRLCLGCSGSKGFSLAPEFRSARADSVFLVWGGNSISHPVIY